MSKWVISIINLKRYDYNHLAVELGRLFLFVNLVKINHQLL